MSFADLLGRSFTKTELQLYQHQHKQLPPKIDFAILQNNASTPIHYLMHHEEILPYQKHDFHPILADYGTDHFSIRIMIKATTLMSNLWTHFPSNL